MQVPLGLLYLISTLFVAFSFALPTRSDSEHTDIEPRILRPGHGGLVSAYQLTSLALHNADRTKHHAVNLTWDANLATYASQTAQTCKFVHNSTFGGGGYGQNIAAVGGTDYQQTDNPENYITMATTQWYNEYKFFSKYYGIASPPAPLGLNSTYLHFTQMVWNSSVTLGCASQFCSAGTMSSQYNVWFTVCNYKAAGNVAGQYAKNVFAP